MNENDRFYVVEAPRRPAKPQFSSPSLQACVDHVTSRNSPGMIRLAIWSVADPPDEGPDAAICVPARLTSDWQALALDAVERWDERWLLIESTPFHHRSEAREDLVQVVLTALVNAAARGIGLAELEEIDVGF